MTHHVASEISNLAKYDLKGFYALFMHFFLFRSAVLPPKRLFLTLILHKVDMNKKIKTCNEFNAPALAPVAEQRHSF